MVVVVLILAHLDITRSVMAASSVLVCVVLVLLCLGSPANAGKGDHHKFEAGAKVFLMVMGVSSLQLHVRMQSVGVA